MTEKEDFYKFRVNAIQEKMSQGYKAYPNKYHVKNTVKEIIDTKPENVVSAGRISNIRRMGKLSFIDIVDNAYEIQLIVRGHEEKPEMEKTDWIMFDESNFDEGIEFFKRGDCIGFTGKVGYSKSNQLSVFVTSLTLLTPCLRTLPTQYFGLKDSEQIYRKRYLDLLTNRESRERFIVRSKVIKSIRKFLDDRDFLEVETPMMNLIPGGAAAKPFVTHHNDLNTDFFLRISPELYLKQLVVGGLNRVYELGKNYRNEGIDLTHNPEFTACEFYMAYGDYNDLMVMTEDMISEMVFEMFNKYEIEYHPEKKEERPDKKIINFSKPYRRIDILEELNNQMKQRIANWNDSNIEEKLNNCKIESSKKYSQEFLTNFILTGNNLEENQEFLVYYLNREGIALGLPHNMPRILDKLIGEYIEPLCTDPTFLIHHPVVMSPLAKLKGDNITERFELFINGKEICNAYTELNDPFDQKRRFEDQVEHAKDGDDEAMQMDKGFVMALEYGLPPTAGWGIGIDRFCMFLSNAANIRDVILFPAMKKEDEKNKI